MNVKRRDVRELGRGLAGVVMATCAAGWLHAAEIRPVRFEKHVIDPDFPAISAVVVDVDGDGKPDVVAAGGPSGGLSRWSNRIQWYRAPDWRKADVGILDAKAILLHIERVCLSQPVTGAASNPVPVEITATDGALGDIWWFRYDRTLQQWTRRIVVTPYVGAHGTACGDIDGDGWADLLVPTQMGVPRNGVVWARNPGSDRSTNCWTVFPLATNFAITGWQEYVRLADLNGDGTLDALHGSDAGDGWLGFWLQGRDPVKPWEAHRLTGTMKQCTNIDAADLTGDGKPDVIGTEGHGTGIWFFPAPEYKPVRIDATLKSTHSLALGDFNDDGAGDIAACGFESRTLACWLNEGQGTFRVSVIDTNQCAYDARAADLDADGDLDILLSGQNSGNLVWYENTLR